jgi:hypothetical protein
MRSPVRATLFVSLLAIVCAGVLWAAYDWFQGRYLRCLLYTSPSPRDRTRSRMPSSA